MIKRRELSKIFGGKVWNTGGANFTSDASAGIAIIEMYVCPSVCPSHSGIVSKRTRSMGQSPT